jgi:hypothetical protein
MYAIILNAPVAVIFIGIIVIFTNALIGTRRERRQLRRERREQGSNNDSLR